MEKGPWVALYFCKACRRHLDDRERSLSDGVCPGCGHVSADQIICAAEQRVARWVSRTWLGWLRGAAPGGYWEFKDEASS